MVPRVVSVIALAFVFTSVFAQERFTVLKDLRGEWMSFQEDGYERVDDIPFTGLNTIYFQLDPAIHAGDFLRIHSNKSYFLFVNGQVRGEFSGWSRFRIDSLLALENRASWIAVHQSRINERDLRTEIVSTRRTSSPESTSIPPRPYNPFRDFVVIAGLLIIVLFLTAFRLNPKLANDYFAVSRIFTSREMEDSQASARLTGGSNIQFYVMCSLMIGYYLLIIAQHLPSHYTLPIHFRASGFWMMWAQWIKFSAVVFVVLVAKVFMIFAMTRLFDMKGMARFHFFNWIRLLLVVLGAATAFLFMYFISRGDEPGYYVGFLTVIIVVLIAWIAVAFFKLSGRTGHSMFHLFSYLCATEIIPLLVTVKVLFQ